MKAFIEPINSEIRQEAQRMCAEIDRLTSPTQSVVPMLTPAKDKPMPPISKILGGTAVVLGALTVYTLATKGSTALLCLAGLGTAAAAWGAYKTAKPSLYATSATPVPATPGFDDQRQKLVEQLQATCKRLDQAWNTLMEAQQAKVQQHIGALDTDSDTRHELMKKVYVHEILSYSTLDLSELLYTATDFPALATALRTCQDTIKQAIKTAVAQQTAIYDSLG